MPINADVVDLEAHLHSSIIPEEAVDMADAFLEVQGVQIPVHKAILALASPVFATAFEAAAKAAPAAQGVSANPVIVPVNDHAVRDVRAALRFLYQRSGSKLTHAYEDLAKSPGDAEPILKFAHKFNMQGILGHCDQYLSTVAMQDNGKLLFLDTNATIAWASIATQCGLSTLTAYAEHHMIRHVDANIWTSSAFARHPLSPDCLLRMLYAIHARKDAFAKEIMGTYFEAECQAIPNMTVQDLIDLQPSSSTSSK